MPRDAESAPAPALLDFGLGHLFEAVRDAVVVTDFDGKIRLWNTAATSIFGYTSEEAVGRSAEIFIPAEDREAYRALARRGSKEARAAWTELPASRKDGAPLTVEVSVSRIPGPDGEPHLLGIFRDVTDRAALAQHLLEERTELRAANAALSRANDALEAFTYVVGHDLKEPVRAVDVLLEDLIAEHGGSMPPDAVATARAAKEANRRLALLLADLIEYSRAAREEEAPRPVSVAEVLASEACHAIYAHLLDERGAVLTVDRSMPRVLATPGSLCRALGNLISNAIRHNTSAHPVVRVRAAPAGDGRVAIVVEDNGAGFPDRARRALEGGQAAGRPGGGFGLLIARRAIDRMGGEARVSQSPEGGAAVALLLPAAD